MTMPEIMWDWHPCCAARPCNDTAPAQPDRIDLRAHWGMDHADHLKWCAAQALFSCDMSKTFAESIKGDTIRSMDAAQAVTAYVMALIDTINSYMAYLPPTEATACIEEMARRNKMFIRAYKKQHAAKSD